MRLIEFNSTYVGMVGIKGQLVFNKLIIIINN